MLLLLSQVDLAWAHGGFMHACQKNTTWAAASGPHKVFNMLLLPLQVDPARQRLLARLPPPPGINSSSSSSNSSNSSGSPANQQGPAAVQGQQAGGGQATDSSSTAAAAAAAAGQTSLLLDGLVSRQPLLLVAEVDELLDELARYVR
jgi:hypothetical protein